MPVIPGDEFNTKQSQAAAAARQGADYKVEAIKTSKHIKLMFLPPL